MLVLVPLGAVAVLGAILAMGAPEERASAARRLPNIVFIYTDDQELSSFTRAVMPRTRRLIAGRGTELERYVVTTPLCCPSRVSYLTGQYAHNNGVFSNRGGYRDLRQKRSTLPAWLGKAGYRTAWVGKFLQGYDETTRISQPAPGWQHWYALAQSRYYDYDLGINGRTVHYGRRPGDYLTRVLTRHAARLVRRYASGGRPLFLTLNYLAPHNGEGGQGRCSGGLPVPDPRDAGAFKHAPLPLPDSFDEADVSDKPAFLQRPPLSAHEKSRLERLYRCRLASLRAVDRGVARLVRAFREERALAETVFVFTSDNGFLLGEHRLRGKGFPHEEAIRVPMALRVPSQFLPGGRRVSSVTEPTASVDIAPTLLKLAGGARPCSDGRCRTLDGRSLLPLIAGRSAAWPGDRGILIEAGRILSTCGYRAIRTPAHFQARYREVRSARRGTCEPAEEVELYDLVRDALQLDNLISVDPEGSWSTRRELKVRLNALSRCAGIHGRDRPVRQRPYCE